MKPEYDNGYVLVRSEKWEIVMIGYFEKFTFTFSGSVKPEDENCCSIFCTYGFDGFTNRNPVIFTPLYLYCSRSKVCKSCIKKIARL